MNITRYEPWNLLNQFYKDAEQTLKNWNGESTVATSTWAPAVDIKEEEKQFVIHADIPGVDPKEIEVFMENGVLTIKGERKLESQDEGKDYKRVERIYGVFYRRFSLPDTADAEKVNATGKNGVLEVCIPKKDVAQPKKITVQVT